MSPVNHDRSVTPIAEFAQKALDAGMTLHELQQRARWEIALEAMRRTGNNRSKAARLAGMHRNSFMRVLNELPPERKPPRSLKDLPAAIRRQMQAARKGVA